MKPFLRKGGNDDEWINGDLFVGVATVASAIALARIAKRKIDDAASFMHRNSRFSDAHSQKSKDENAGVIDFERDPETGAYKIQSSQREN